MTPFLYVATGSLLTALVRLLFDRLWPERPHHFNYYDPCGDGCTVRRNS